MSIPVNNIGKTLASFLMVLFAMPLGHALMIVMEKLMDPVTMHYAAFAMGAIGLAMVIRGVFLWSSARNSKWRGCYET